jgi:hypothetical protein
MFDIFTTEKFGSDNASAQQQPIPLEELADTAERTLEEQRAGQAVHEEEGDMEEVDTEFFGPDGESPFSAEEDGSDLDGGLDDSELADDFWGEEDVVEEAIDPRWYKEEYLLLSEDVDWGAIENDPNQLFTIGNSKVGMDTIIFNLQPARFCPSLHNGMCTIVKPIDGVYKIACYAYQDERQYRVALQLRLRQMRYWDTHSADEIFSQLESFYHLSKGSSLVKKMWKAPDKIPAKDRVPGGPKLTPAIHGKKKDSIKLQFIRFNQSGDLKNVADAKKMDKIAKLAKEKLNLVTYTYTARKDILDKYKFQNVHIQGSGFSAITGINKPVKTKKGVTIYGKTFKAYPSIYNKKGELLDRQPGVLYYEDIMEKKIPGTDRDNPHYDLWNPKNKGGWFPCKGDCNPCRACKSDDVKLIACKIHRSFQKMSPDWHNVRPVMIGDKEEYRVRQKTKPYIGRGYNKIWTPGIETEYETNAEILRQELKFRTLPKQEKIDYVTDRLHELYVGFEPDWDEESYEDWKDRSEKMQNKAKKLGIDWQEIKKEYGLYPIKRKKKE